MPLFDLASLSAGLPAAAVLPALAELAAAGPVHAVIEAPPGTGKTTLVPPALATARAAGSGGNEPGRKRSGRPDGPRPVGPSRVVVAQPRRMAARSAARRLAHLSGTRLGDQVGYTVRGDRRTSRATAVEFVTYGVLVRRLLRDPELPEIGAVVLDEVHERHLEADLAFGMLRELIELRPDLSLVVMSATLDAETWAELLGEGADAPAPVLRARAQAHPLDIRWAPPARRPLDARGVQPAFLDHVARQVQTAAELPEAGDVLVFLPGRREVERVAGLLRQALPAATEVHTLTGSTPPADQDRVLSASRALDGNRVLDGRWPGSAGSQRVIVATAVAESSLTVPGVRTVVDSGLSREPRLHTGRGMSGLVTVRASKAAGTQRAGRAAREGPGRVVRCMAEADWAALPATTPPEIRSTDLTSAVLDLACWGAPGGAGLRLPDQLPIRARAAAEDTLHGLGALDDLGRATEFGRELALIPADPRLGRALLLGTDLVGARTAAEAVAALSLDLRAPGGDLVALLRSLRRFGDRAWRAEADRFERLTDREGPGDTLSDQAVAAELTLLSGEAGSGHLFTRETASEEAGIDAAVGLVAALARPDRIAHLRRRDTPGEYQFASGTGAELPRDSGLAGHAWLAVAEVGLSGERALIRAGAPITREIAEFAGRSLLGTEDEARFEDGRVRARRIEKLGAIELASTPVRPSAAAEEAAWQTAVASLGPGVLEPGDEFESLRRRLGFLHAASGEPWPDVRWEALLRRFAGRVAERAPVGWLHEMMPWPQAADLDRLVPVALEVPSGRQVRLSYPKPEAGADPPVLAVKLQECFGWAAGPQVCGVPVVLHLLSPAGRPLAVTSGLASFWNGAYAQVRAENRRRYAKHPWPEDPWNAPPARGTTKSGR